MTDSGLRPIRWKTVVLCILLCYPIMGSRWFPFGGGPRYLSVLVAPICILLLLQELRKVTVKPLLVEIKTWCLPFLPFVLCWVFAQIWHQYEPLDLTPLTHLLWCALLFAGARLIGINYRQLFMVACIFSTIYGVIGIGEVFIAGRNRAWGGVYENRFGQYAIWLSSVCVLHGVLPQSGSKSRLPVWVWSTAAVFGLVATWLSGSRGALAALMVLVVVILFTTADWRKSMKVIFALLASISAVLYFSPNTYSRFEVAYLDIWGYFHETVFTPTSVGIRLELARVSILTLLDYPIVGPGYSSLKELYLANPQLGNPDPGILEIPGFHSDWFQAIGIGGGMLFCALLGTSVWLYVTAKRDPYRLSFLGFACVFSLSELFLTHTLGLGLLMACWALYSAAKLNQLD